MTSSRLGPPHALVGADDGFGERLEQPFLWLPYLLLAASLVVGELDFLTHDTGGGRRGWVIGLAVVAAGWTGLALPRRPDQQLVQRLRIYFVVRLVLTAVLVGVCPWFGIYAWFGYIEAIRFFALPYGFFAIVASSLTVSASYLAGYPRHWSQWALYLVIAAGSSVLVSFFAVSARRSSLLDLSRRDQLLETNEANRRLQTALDENRGLQTQLVAQAREAGVADERARLAGEIHDTLAQTLTGIVTQLEAAQRGGDTDPRVQAAKELARTGLTEARRALHALRPGPLEGSRLPEALAETATAFSQRSGVPALLEVSGDVVPLATDNEVALLRVAQEALVNVERHAQAHRVGLTLSYLDDEVLLDVRDDGIGLESLGDVEPSPGHGLGLAAMRERLDRVAGDLIIESQPGDGTALLARVPLVRRDRISPSTMENSP